MKFIGNHIAATFWNSKVIGRLRQEEAFPGAHITVLKLPGGQLVSQSDSGLYQHPWFTSLRWNPKGQKSDALKAATKAAGDPITPGVWEAFVRPGFVNGEDPTAKVKQEDGTLADIGLVDAPPIPLNQFAALLSFPKFFEALGVKKEKSNISINLTTGNVTVDETQREDSSAERRYLQSCDLFLSVARPTYAMTTQVEGNLVTGHLVDYTVSFDTSAMQRSGTRARLHSAAAMPQPYRPTLLDRLMGVHGDDGEDRILVATIFFLSPAGWAPKTGDNGNPLPLPPPNGFWIPFVQHHLFWNLCHASKNLPPVNTKQSATDPFLSFFVGRYTIAPQATLGAMEAEGQRLLAGVLNSTSNEGKFWSV